MSISINFTFFGKVSFGVIESSDW